MQEKKKMNFLFAWFYDHLHLLFKSAAHNHLRIQNALKNSDGTFQLTMQFESYSELKKYQKKLRTISISLSSALAMTVVAFIVAPYILNPSKSKAASFQWIQNSWAGTAGAELATKTGWTNYASKDENITATETGISLTLSTPQSVTENADADFTGTKTGDGFYTNGSGQLLLKKPTGATCAIGGECASGTCTSTLCT
ncbi:MAG: hypothetical protein US57_C0019G0005 [Candidatus Moranbacteria bacterium GW2011_GWC2_37_73]|nr:MAG: hypothetical protein UR95_C0009G0005 [Parcubacteria group bacterium GW2011_GWC1_36_108]KKP99923.1 MAG: hypothetical protein US09_C0028G0006 [Candidatus Moranbacteria bacterium GW2011_GWD1_36_198]KKQ00278.1 MAG: hypothetical protein US10_C0036G0005 [Candidatus Moranbacteria bacterium GW2011_GWD2_36_198]KKQ39141.1 MAG: hypothetical protein US57_C0019G0005 [Candidatus Moranbacteria bacterium GW2011_GWC2_37_73]HAR99579.1 hypothetical protein [Candidatus Moranbacteria bacterium]